MITLTLHPSGEKVKIYKSWTEKFIIIEERDGFSVIGNLRVKETRSEIHQKLMGDDGEENDY